jgi:uncharacterized membrane protein YjfL (UPF0719 family)
MATKQAGMGAAFIVLAVVLGLIIFIGVILLMMWFQPGIEHSPSGRGTLSGPRSLATAQISAVSMLVRNFCSCFGAKP